MFINHKKEMNSLIKAWKVPEIQKQLINKNLNYNIIGTKVFDFTFTNSPDFISDTDPRHRIFDR